MKYIVNISARVVAADNRAAIIYAKTDGLLYKWLKGLFFFAISVSIIMSLLYIGGRASHLYEIKKLGLDVLSSADINSVKSSILTVGICTLVWIIAALLVRFKLEVTSAVITLASGIVSCASLINASQNTAQFNTGINENFWFRHFIPLFIAFFFLVWMVIIKVRQKYLFHRSYTNMVGRIYLQFHTDDLNEEQWNEFLENYDPRAEEEKRRRLKKQGGKYTPIYGDQADKK